MEMDRNRSRATAGRRRVGRIVVRGETHLTAQVRDEAELFGLLERLRDLGAALVSVAIDP
jgi:hypothetical protein